MFSLIEWSLGKRNEMIAKGHMEPGKPKDHSCSPRIRDMSLPSIPKRKRNLSNGSPGNKLGKQIPTSEKPWSGSGPTLTPNRKSEAVMEWQPNGLPSPKGLPNRSSGQQSLRLDDARTPLIRRQPAEVSHSSSLTQMQQSIKSHFGLEVMLKHNELRLIEQELAKCQISLEQLRRCHVVPYPARNSKVEDMSNSGGPAKLCTRSEESPASPLLRDATDGPYLKHYAHWLLPDSASEAAVVSEIAPRQDSRKRLPERSTRAGKLTHTTPSAKGRVRRGSTSRLHALPAGYPEPKEEKGPMIVRRSTDGRMVKLVCLDCRRENFNSTQGFINHCRIAHSRGFASHDVAALACGEEIEYNDAGALVSEAGSTPTNAGLVHPLVRSALVAARQNTPSALAAPRSRSMQQFTQPPSAAASSPSPLFQTQTLEQSPFVAAPTAPHLSALFSRSGLGGNLESLVTEATARSNLSALPTDDEASDVDDNTSMPATPAPISHLRASRLPTRATMSSTSTVATKGVERQRAARPPHINTTAPLRRLPIINSPAKIMAPSIPRTASSHNFHSAVSHPYDRHISDSTHSHTQSPHLAHTTAHGHPTPIYTPQSHSLVFPPDHDTVPDAPSLSPTTVETNPAPSLVSDDDEDDDYDDEEEDDENEVDLPARRESTISSDRGHPDEEADAAADEDEYFGLGSDDEHENTETVDRAACTSKVGMRGGKVGWGKRRNRKG